MDVNSLKVINFSDLTDEEKNQYIKFLLLNNIEFEKNTDQFFATIKVKPPKAQSAASKQNSRRPGKLATSSIRPPAAKENHFESKGGLSYRLNRNE